MVVITPEYRNDNNLRLEVKTIKFPNRELGNIYVHWVIRCSFFRFESVFGKRIEHDTVYQHYSIKDPQNRR